MPIMWYQFLLLNILLVLLSIVLLASFIGLLEKKYRKYMPKLLFLLGALSSALLLTNYFIYRSFVSAENDVSRDGIMMGWDPFEQYISITLNWQIPCILVVIVATLILKNKIKITITCWIGMATAIASICGLIILAHSVFARLMGGLSSAAWWL